MRKNPWRIPAILLLICAGTMEAHASSWYLENSWGGSGTGAGEFQDPRALAFGPNNDVYVADYGNARVQQFDEDGNFVRAWGAAGDAAARFDFIKSITVDNDGNVYVLDGNSLAKFTSDGQFLKITDPPIQVLGYHLAISQEDIIYTVGSSSLVGYNTNLTEVSRYEVAGCGEDSYGGITMADQRIYVTDVTCQAIDVYSEPGDRLNHWTFNGLISPFSIAESNAQLFITSPTERAIRIVSVDGSDVGSIPVPQFPDSAMFPLAVAAHRDAIYVLAGDYLLKFSPTTAVDNTSWSVMKQRYQ